MATQSVNRSQRIAFSLILLLVALGLFIILFSPEKKEDNSEADKTETATTKQLVEQKSLPVSSEQTKDISEKIQPRVPPLETELIEKTQENILDIELVEPPAVVVPETLTEEFPMELPLLTFTADTPVESKEESNDRGNPPTEPVEEIVEVKKESVVNVPTPSQKQTLEPESWVLYHYYYRLSQNPYGQRQWDVVLVPVQNKATFMFTPVIPTFPVMPFFSSDYCYIYHALDFFYSWTLYYRY